MLGGEECLAHQVSHLCPLYQRLEVLNIDYLKGMEQARTLWRIMFFDSVSSSMRCSFRFISLRSVTCSSPARVFARNLRRGSITGIGRSRRHSLSFFCVPRADGIGRDRIQFSMSSLFSRISLCWHSFSCSRWRTWRSRFPARPSEANLIYGVRVRLLEGAQFVDQLHVVRLQCTQRGDALVAVVCL